MEFKGGIITRLSRILSVDIETEWNLKNDEILSLSRRLLVDIETEWNLKESKIMTNPPLPWLI